MPKTLVSRQTAILREEKANNTNAGTGAAAYNTRILNTIQDPTGMILNAAAFTGVGGTNTQVQLGAGTYMIRVKAPFCSPTTAGQIQGSKVRVQNITDSTTLVTGQSARTSQLSAGTPITQLAQLDGTFTLTATKTIEIQQRLDNAGATNIGLGQAINIGENEVYTQVEIEKISM